MLHTKHSDLGHAGASTVISVLGQSYLILGARGELKKVQELCTVCQRANAHTQQQIMAPLPDCRTKLAPPFLHIGVDMAGPFTLREGSTRKPVCFKAYLCIFVCMSTKAVHLEICRSLNTEEFLAVFSRLFNGRGSPSEMYSDNGSNFVAAAKELSAAVTDAMKKDRANTQRSNGISICQRPPTSEVYERQESRVRKD